MIYKTLKKNDKWMKVEFGFDSLIGDYAEVYSSDVPELFTELSLKRLEFLGVDTTDLQVVEVELKEI